MNKSISLTKKIIYIFWNIYILKNIIVFIYLITNDPTIRLFIVEGIGGNKKYI